MQRLDLFHVKSLNALFPTLGAPKLIVETFNVGHLSAAYTAVIKDKAPLGADIMIVNISAVNQYTIHNVNGSSLTQVNGQQSIIDLCRSIVVQYESLLFPLHWKNNETLFYQQI